MAENSTPSPLLPSFALGGAAPKVETIGAVTLSEVDDWSLAAIAARRGRLETFMKLSADMIGMGLPGPGGMVAADDWQAFWTGPESWMLVSLAFEDIATHVKTALGETASVTEQSGGWFRVTVTAPDVAALLERLCNIDPVRAGQGTATRTTIAHLGVYVLHSPAGQVAILGPRSSAVSLWQALVEAAKSIA